MGPLKGYRVLDFTGEIGQYCGKLLAEMGAEVIKVEPPEGDPVRKLGPFYLDERDANKSLRWFTLNGSKRGVTLALDTTGGRDLLERLLDSAQVVLTSWTRREAEALGMDERAVRQRHPDLVYTSITGYGLDGPYADYRWCDMTGLALGGFMFLTGDADRPPVVFRAPQAYLNASGQAATGTALALFHRTRTGNGQLVDVSMQEAVTYNLNGPGSIVSWWSGLGMNIGRQGGSLNFGHIIWRVMLPCKDGYAANSGILGSVGGRFQALVDLMEKEGVAEDLTDPKWLTATTFPAGPGHWQASQEQLDHAYDIFENWLKRHTKAEIMELAVRHDLQVYPVNTTADLLESPQLDARAYFVDVPHPELDRSIRYAGPPYKLSLTPAGMRHRAPLLGEHNQAVYGDELGLSREQIESLKADGVIS